MSTVLAQKTTLLHNSCKLNEFNNVMYVSQTASNWQQPFVSCVIWRQFIYDKHKIKLTVQKLCNS